MITLYKYAHPSRAEMVVWALEELGFDYEVKALDGKKAEQRSDKFLAINPFGKIPAMTHNDAHFTESLAIIEYLNDLHPDKPLTPSQDEDNYANKNYKLRQVISFGVIEIESYLWILTKIKVFNNFENWPENAADNCIKSIHSALPLVMDWLEAQDYIAGARFTFADIYYHHLFGWLQMLGFELPEQVNSYVKRLSARERFPKK